MTAFSSATQFLWDESLAVLHRYCTAKKITLAHSLAIEDVVLSELLAQTKLLKNTQVFTLNTGRLHDETLALISRLESHYQITITQYHPQAKAVAAYIATNGIDAIYHSSDLRKLCCHIRKSEPLARALDGHEIWLTGQRRAQSVTRSELAIFEHDSLHHLDKLNPLANWTDHALWEVAKNLNLPYNNLHDQGFPSIGCQPCTRPIEAGEDIRAGRWWWERPQDKECGLHVVNGQLQRIKR